MIKRKIRELINRIIVGQIIGNKMTPKEMTDKQYKKFIKRALEYKWN